MSGAVKHPGRLQWLPSLRYWRRRDFDACGTAVSRTIVIVALVLTAQLPCSGQVNSLTSVDPAGLNDLCGIAYDAQIDVVYVYGCFSTEIHKFARNGILLGTIPRPGESTNDVDLHVAPEALSIGGTTVPRGTLLLINGETGPAEIYAVDPETGAVLEILNTQYGRGSIVGGAYSPIRDTFFLVNFSDDVIGEIDPVTGETLATFDITTTVDVFYGDVEVSPITGHLFVVTDVTDAIFEFTPDGRFQNRFDMPTGLGDFSGIGLDCQREEAWVSTRSGVFHRLWRVPCGSTTGGGQISVTEPSGVEAVSGGDVPLQATLPAGYNPITREVCYRRTGEAVYSCTSMDAVGDAYQAAIPASFVSARGVEYYYRFSDGATETTVPEFDPQNSAFVLPVRFTELRAGGAFQARTYRMVSVPVDLDDRGVESVLSSFGPVDTRRWRLLRWIPGLGSYAEYPNMDGAFDPCEAYWLISFNGDDFEVGDGESVDPLEPCFVTVQPGWNQFGSPYAFPVAWTDVVFDGFLDGPVLYDAATDGQDPYVYDVEVLEPWQGYWVFNPGTQNVFLSFRPVEATGKAGKSARDRHLAGDEFELRLKAVLPEYGLADTRNHVGLSADATDAFDELDFAEAPPIGDHVRLSILEDDLRLAGSIRPDDGRGQVWDLRISAERNGAPVNGFVRVTLEEFGARPDGFGLQVVDPDVGLPVRLDGNEFEIELTSSRPVRNLRLIVGSAAFMSEAAKAVSDVPQRAELAQNYPNPFRTSTRIGYHVDTGGRTELVVFDPLGRRVRTLVDAHREPGLYETEWNGRDDAGGDASSGLYFYVLRTTDGADSGTMVVLR